MADPFIFEAWLDTVGFANEAARTETEAFLRRSEFTTRESLLGFVVEQHAPDDFPDGRKAALRRAIAILQAEAGMSSASSNFFYCYSTIPTTIHRLSLFSIPIATFFFVLLSSNIRTAPAAASVAGMCVVTTYQSAFFSLSYGMCVVTTYHDLLSLLPSLLSSILQFYPIASHRITSHRITSHVRRTDLVHSQQQQRQQQVRKVYLTLPPKVNACASRSMRASFLPP